jgi:hypothetical protein
MSKSNFRSLVIVSLAAAATAISGCGPSKLSSQPGVTAEKLQSVQNAEGCLDLSKLYLQEISNTPGSLTNTVTDAQIMDNGRPISEKYYQKASEALDSEHTMKNEDLKNYFVKSKLQQSGCQSFKYNDGGPFEHTFTKATPTYLAWEEKSPTDKNKKVTFSIELVSSNAIAMKGMIGPIYVGHKCGGEDDWSKLETHFLTTSSIAQWGDAPVAVPPLEGASVKEIRRRAKAIQDPAQSANQEVFETQYCKSVEGQ